MIRLLLGFVRLPDTDVLLRGWSVYHGLLGNPRFPDPPVKLSDFKAELNSFASAAARAVTNGGKTAYAERNKQRAIVIKMMRHLGHYVEVVAADDTYKLVSSGFEVSATSAPGPAERCPQPYILKIRQGSTGVLLISITPLYRQAVHYDLRHAPLDANGEAGTWTSRTLTKARQAVGIENLTPGTVYAFQVRALGKDGQYTDWSPTATRMCT